MSNPWTKLAPVTERRTIATTVEKQVIAFELDEDKIAKMLKEAIIAKMSDGEKARWPDVEVRLYAQGYDGEDITAEVKLVGDPQ